MSVIDPSAFCWYRSETKLGLIILGVEASEAEQANLQGQHRVFQQAALLANTEVMIQAIELWQEIDLDLYPCDAPDSTSIHLSLTLKDVSNIDQQSNESSPSQPTAEEQDSGTQSADVATDEASDETELPAPSNPNVPIEQQRLVLVFDCDTLIQLNTLSTELQSVLTVTSSEVEFSVQLDQMNLPPEEMAAIDAGAVAVIAASYQPEWDIVAVSLSADIPLRFDGSASPGEQAIQIVLSQHATSSFNKLSAAQEVTADTVSLWCQQPCAIPVIELLGVGKNAHVTQPYTLDTRELSLAQGESTIAHGSLLPYGRGSVVAISERLRD